MFLSHHWAEIRWFECSWFALFFQILAHDSKKWTTHNKFTPVAEHLMTSFPTLNTTSRPLICWHTAPGHSWKQDVLLLLFKLNRFKSGSQLNFKNRCSVAEGLNWPQQWEAVSLELEYSFVSRTSDQILELKTGATQGLLLSPFNDCPVGLGRPASRNLGLGNKLMFGRFRCLDYEGVSEEGWSFPQHHPPTPAKPPSCFPVHLDGPACNDSTVPTTSPDPTVRPLP